MTTEEHTPSWILVPDDWLPAQGAPAVRMKLRTAQAEDLAEIRQRKRGWEVCVHNQYERRIIMPNENNQQLFAEYPDVVNVEQLSSMLQISTKTAYKLLREGKIKSIHIGRNYKIAKKVS